jgi:flagellar L-ring protein precursor FlgH
MKLINLLMLIWMLMVVSGCENIPVADPAFAPVRPAALRPPEHNTGSIYQANYDMRLFEDHIARRVGDILTIKLVEKTQAKKDADLEVIKDSDINIKAPTLWGVSAAAIMGKDIETEVKARRKFGGEGKANQSNSLTGEITVTVIEVLPNGNLMVRGEKRVTLNQGNEFIRLSGIVRPIDIDASNTVLSSRVANPTIMYTGEGAVADASKLGWFSRIFMSWLFPF